MKISVCIPTYNQAHYLKETLESVLNQTRKADEIIVSNDFSSDDTVAVLEKYSEIPCIKIVNQTKNLGMNRNTDACLRYGNGDYIVKLDSDDKLKPTYIEKLEILLNKYPEAGYAHAAVEEIDEHGAFKNHRLLARKREFINSDESLKMSLKGYRVAANIIMFRKSALERAGYITSKINFAEDYFLSVALAGVGYGNVYCPDILSEYRVWSDAGNLRQRRKLDEIAGVRNVVDKAILPAYKSRGWKLAPIQRMRRTLAVRHSNSLGWKVFTAKEKEEIKIELLQLSNDQLVRFFSWCYLNGFGNIFEFYGSSMNFVKSRIKTLLFK